MEPQTAASSSPDPEAVGFIRFCYERRRVGWPELYDEMCGVAARGLYRGYGSDDLAAFGIGFSLFEMPALAAMSAAVIAEEKARRRPVNVTIHAGDPAAAPPSSDAHPETHAMDGPAPATAGPERPTAAIDHDAVSSDDAPPVGPTVRLQLATSRV